MQNLTELKSEHAQLIVDGERILDDAENRALTDSENTRYNAIVKSLQRLSLDIAKQDKQRVPTFSGRTQQPSAELDDTEIPAHGSSRSRIALPSSHGVKMRAFPNSRAGKEAAYSAGMWLKATLLQDPQAGRYCRDHGMNSDVMAAAATSPNTAGGALVPDILANRIIDLREEYGLFRQQADVVPMSSDTEIFPVRAGGLTATFTAENSEISESDLLWSNISLTAKKLGCLSRMSSEISEDAIVSVGDRFAVEIAAAFATREDEVGFNGTGAGTDGGIVGVLTKAIDGNHALAKVAATTPHNTMAEIDADDLLRLMSAIPQYAKKGAAWYCSPSAKSLIFDAIKIAGGGNTASMLAAVQTDTFLGYPINVTPVMADTPATDYNNAVIVGFGNLRQAVMMGSRREIRIALSEHRYFELDQVGIRGTERFDINAHSLGSASVKSPFAVLCGTT